MLELFTDKVTYQKFAKDYSEKKIRYGEMKEALANEIYKELKPFQERRKKFEDNPSLVDSIIAEGAVSCREMAEETMKEVREKMGFSNG